MTTRLLPPALALSSEQSIDEDRCHLLLRSTRVARLAFVDGDLPHVVVLNHLPDGDDVLLRTDAGTRLASSTAGGRELPVVLEVDSFSAADRSGWSVLAEGSLTRDDGAADGRLPDSWRSGPLDVVLRLRVARLSGRRVGTLEG